MGDTTRVQSPGLPVSIEWTIPVQLLGVVPEVLGRPLDLGERDGHRITAVFIGPDPEDDHWAAATRIRVTVDTSTAMTSLGQSWDGREPIPEEEAEVSRLRVAAAAAMEHCIIDVIDYLGVAYGRSRVRLDNYHVGAGQVDVNGILADFGGPPAMGVLISRPRGIKLHEMEAIAKWIRHGMRPGTGWRLYLDAARRWYHEEDLRATVVELASAVEVGAAESFRRVSQEPEVLEIALRGARAGELMTSLSRATLKGSLADSDQPTYLMVIDLLKERNAFVHRGVIPTGSAMGYLEAVRLTLQFFDARRNARAAELGLPLI